jgi:asparagine synthetase B (glutamine-hydrolysing)
VSRESDRPLLGTAPSSRLTPLEIASGLPLGFEAEPPPLPVVPDGVEPLAAFEDAVRAALERPPCVVNFSGGRDSSAVLAVAARIARREGLPSPVPVTLRFSEASGPSEARWQEAVVRFLRLGEWVRLEVGEEIDYVGPVARRLLLRHGVLHPPVTPLFWLPLELARGGSLLTGLGGDAIAGGWLPPHFAQALAGRVRPRPRDLRALAYSLAPKPGRRAAMRFLLTRPPWLRQRARRAFVRLRAKELASRPVRWDRFLAWEVGQRGSRAFEATLSILAADVDAVVAHPFHDRRFVAALAGAGGARGIGDRTTVMRALFSGDLPDDVLARWDKSHFAFAYFRGHTREFARRWEGGGVDANLVDPEVLRSAWLLKIVDARSALALQAAWLDSAQRGLEGSPSG